MNSELKYLALPFKDVISLEMVQSKKLLVPDAIQIGMPNNQIYTFSFYFQRKHIYQMLMTLCDAAMNRLIKGAENSLSASAELFAKTSKETTGDLAVHLGSKAGALLASRSRENMSSYRYDSQPTVEDVVEQDFTEQSVNDLKIVESPLVADDKDKVKQLKGSEIPRYGQVLAANLYTASDLSSQLKKTEFRSIFRLPIHESIIDEELGCWFFQKSNSSSFNGNLYISQSYISFTATPTGALSLSDKTFSQIFEISYDSQLLFSIPFAHIVSIKKQPPTALATTSKLTSFSLSGFLVINTKNKLEFWLSFSSLKNRDKMNDLLFQKIKSINWEFDQDIMIGIRNGGAIKSLSLEFTTTLAANRKGLPDSAEDLQMDATGILLSGLKYSFPLNNDLNDVDEKESERIWNDYLNATGRDVCMMRDFPALRNLIVSTFGVPSRLRGDFWYALTFFYF